MIIQDVQTKKSHDLVSLGLTLGLEKSRSDQWWCSKLFPNRVCGLKTLQDLSCCYLLAAGSHWNPWNNKLNLFVPLPEAQSELLLFESRYSSCKFNLNFMWSGVSSGGTFRGTESPSQGWPRLVQGSVTLTMRHTPDTGGTSGGGSDQTNNASVMSPSRAIMSAKNMDLKAKTNIT